MNVLKQQIESVARALYDAEDDAQAWDNEPEILKEEFRLHARDAIALFEQSREQMLEAA